MKTLFDKNLRRPNFIFVKKIKKIFFYYVRPKDKKILYVYSSKGKSSVKKINLTFFDSHLIKLDKLDLFGEVNIYGTKLILRNFKGQIIKTINLSKKKNNIQSVLFNEKENKILILDGKFNQLITINIDNLRFFKLTYKKFRKNILNFNNANLCLKDSNEYIFFNYNEIYFINKKFQVIKKFSKSGKDGPYSFRNITSVKIYRDNIVVCDQRNYKIKFYNKNFIYQKSIGQKGNHLKQFDLPSYLEVCDNKLFIADMNNDRILAYEKNVLNELLKTKFDKNLLRRPIKIIRKDNHLIALDRDNCRLIFLTKNLKIFKSIILKKIINGKPNSFDILKYKKKFLFVVLYRFSNFKNKILIFDFKGKIFDQIKINLKDAQDLSIFDKNIAIANTNNRSIVIYDYQNKFISEKNLTQFTLNRRLLNKTICWDSYGNIYTADFDKCIVLKFDINLKYLDKYSFQKIQSELKVIRGIQIYNDDLFLLNRGEYPLIVYDLKNNKILKRYKKYKKEKFYNPSSVIVNNNMIYFTDKENDRIVKLQYR